MNKSEVLKGIVYKWHPMSQEVGQDWGIRGIYLRDIHVLVPPRHGCVSQRSRGISCPHFSFLGLAEAALTGASSRLELFNLCT